ncbi:MAG TPA: hemerythrin domain-containing protein [Gaiellaceae bacterium]|nr:hemerythrin domain-containing protein [Gaiellaceae bacterium]
MSGDQFRIAHEQFTAWTDELRLAARRLPELDPGERLALVSDLVAFLHDSVEPHTRVDEQVLYHDAAERLGSPLVTASLAYDHLAIRTWIAKLAEADEEDVDTLQELLYGLDALIRVHIWKEDELLVRPLGSSTWPASGA